MDVKKVRTADNKKWDSKSDNVCSVYAPVWAWNGSCISFSFWFQKLLYLLGIIIWNSAQPQLVPQYNEVWKLKFTLL